MYRYKRKPTSPGEILLEEFLIPLGKTQKQLADHIKCDYKVINRIINEKSSVTPDIAFRLSQALETSPEFWLNAQMALDLWTIDKHKKKIGSFIDNKRKKAA